MAAFYGVTRFLAWTLLIVGLLLGLARLTVVRWLRLPTNDPVLTTSTLPTLGSGDLIVVGRVTKPTFGDLVLCPEPNYPTRYVIGRIVGEPGDEVSIKDGYITVNAKPFVLERTCDPADIVFPHPDRPSEEVQQQCGWEVIANQLHMVGTTAGHKIRPFDRSFVVPDGQWFLASDNRLFPYDSRDFGYVEQTSCKETVLLRLVSGDGWMDSKKRLTFIQ